MQPTYIVAAARTPIGKFGGALRDVSPVELGAQVTRALLARAGIDGDALDHYIFGNILKHGHGQLLPRQAALRGGVPENVDGYAVDMLCSSGMLAAMNAHMAIQTGEADLVMAGGIESMSQAAFILSHKARWGYKLLMGDQTGLTDALLEDGLRDPTTGELMGEETERLAKLHEVSRTELDEIACISQQRAAAAMEAGKFAAEIVPITVSQGREETTIDKDEGIRAGTTLEGLGKLRPAFSKDGVFTAGNASQMSDGAAGLLLAGERAVERYNLQPLARLLGSAGAGVTPWRFVEGPIPAITKLLRKLEMGLEEFDLIENNEAFALNSILLQRELNASPDRLNVYGGGIALGHPIGATGARILVTLLHAMQQEKKPRGLAALCHGLGGATTVALEQV